MMSANSAISPQPFSRAWVIGSTPALPGEEAVRYLAVNHADLIVLDMIMDPGMGGLETYRQIIAHTPGQRAIIASGYSESQDIRKALEIGVGRYLKKPYTLIGLGMAVWEELHTRDSRGPARQTGCHAIAQSKRVQCCESFTEKSR
jgi:CheY-like chemotaxis protein